MIWNIIKIMASIIAMAAGIYLPLFVGFNLWTGLAGLVLMSTAILLFPTKDEEDRSCGD